MPKNHICVSNIVDFKSNTLFDLINDQVFTVNNKGDTFGTCLRRFSDMEGADS